MSLESCSTFIIVISYKFNILWHFKKFVIGFVNDSNIMHNLLKEIRDDTFKIEANLTENLKNNYPYNIKFLVSNFTYNLNYND